MDAKIDASSKTEHDFELAVVSDDLDLVKHYHASGCPFDRTAFIEAARNGNIDILEFLHNAELDRIGKLKSVNRKPSGLQPNQPEPKLTICWNEYAFCAAALVGDMKTMEWLHKKGCPWNYEVYLSAIADGNLNNIIWLFTNGCPWNIYVVSAASRSDDLAIREWAEKNLVNAT
jgi:hypothetical protein